MKGSRSETVPSLPFGETGVKAILTEGPKVYTVRELTRQIRTLIESHFPAIWVEGEISGFKHHHSGHIYFNLKDSEAVIKAAFFSRFNRNLKFDLKDGLQVLCSGKISVYEPRGDYQLYVEKIEPKGLGALQLAFLQLKEKLSKEGLFDPAHKRPIPRFPRTVGVVTSPTGAAIRDILHVVNRRFRGTDVLLNPVRVQGEGAAEEIARALDEMNRFEDIDVLIVGRGGGSLEDLWAFNEEAVARAVSRSRIPVISAVGHEIDWTICDWVADLRAPTPSAAAEIVVQSREDLEIRLGDFAVRLRNAVRNILEARRQTLRELQESYAFRQPLQLINQQAQRLDELLRQFQNYVKNLVREKCQALENWAGRLESLSPLAVLGRGYSITFIDKGKILQNALQAKVGDTIHTRLSHGTIYSKVNQIVKENESNEVEK